MLLIIIGVLIALTATAAVYRMLLTGRTNTAPFGWMNDKWLAEHRASREA